MNQNKKYFSVVIILFGTASLVIGFLSGWYLTSKSSEQQTPSPVADASQIDSPSEARDKIRKEHSLTLVSRLFTRHLILKQSVSAGQAGLDEIQTLNDQESLSDPLTKNPYIFNGDQLKMVVGEVIFRVNSSCDDKIQGSDGNGMIIDATPSSVAVAIKLESGQFSCETNL